eukprot:1354684-Amorphochlora_amoeboformis.AAC.2
MTKEVDTEAAHLMSAFDAAPQQSAHSDVWDTATGWGRVGREKDELFRDGTMTFWTTVVNTIKSIVGTGVLT